MTHLTHALATVALVALAAACGAMDEAAPTKKVDAGAPPLGDAGGGLPLILETQGTIHPGDRIVLRADPDTLVETFSWQVTSPAGEVAYSIVDPKVGWRKVAFQADVAGSYIVTCAAKLAWGKGQQYGTAAVPVEALNAKKRVYTVRIIPPPSSPLPPTDHIFEVGGEDQIQQTWIVAPGISKTFAATVGGKRIEAYLRLLSAANDPYPRDIFLSKDGTPVKVSGTFHALLLPTSTTLAANLYPDLNAATLATSWVAELDARSEIQGTILQSGVELAGAKVTLHRKGSHGIVVPSSIGVTDANGAFLVSAQNQSGTGTLTVTPPSGQGLPIALVEGIGAVTAKQGWQLDYNVAAPVIASGSVRRFDGSKPAAGATLVLTMESGQVGMLTIPGASAIPAKGRLLITLVSDGDGILRDPETKASTLKLPAGSYQAELWPGKTETIDQGYRRTTLVLGAGDPFEVKLALRATLEGTVVDRDGKPVLAAVTAVSSGSSFASSTKLENGKYSMNVDDNTSYALTVRPIESAMRLGTYFLPQLKVAGNAQTDFKLPGAVIVSGTLMTTGKLAIPGALMRLCSTTCTANQIVDETQTTAKGSFVLRIPTETP